MPAIDIERVCAEEGLRHLGERYGKAGEFWGMQGHSRVIAIGRRDVMVNVFLISIGRDDQVKRPDTRWTMHATKLQSQMDESTLRKWCEWVKRGYSTADLREQARKKYLAGTPDPTHYGYRPVVVLTGAAKRDGAG